MNSRCDRQVKLLLLPMQYNSKLQQSLSYRPTWILTYTEVQADRWEMQLWCDEEASIFICYLLIPLMTLLQFSTSVVTIVTNYPLFVMYSVCYSTVRFILTFSREYYFWHCPCKLQGYITSYLRLILCELLYKSMQRNTFIEHISLQI